MPLPLLPEHGTKATIRDVARRAGVSVATVSRVFNDSKLVTKNTAARIQKAAEELSYVPSGSARSLSTRKNEMIGLLLPDIYGEFFSEIIRGADLAARRVKYHLLVSSSHSNSQELGAAICTMRGRVDGMIIMSPHLDSGVHLRSLVKVMPAVVLNCAESDGQFDSIVINNLGGAVELMRHLIERGHRRIAIIKGESGNLDAEERLRGYKAALAEADIAPRPEYMIDGNFTESSGYEATRSLLSLTDKPSAIFASNDSMAIGAFSALRERGISVPSDIALAGFDDTPIAHYVHPSLTSVHIDISELGAMAVGLLLERIESKGTKGMHKRIVLPARLVIRESTAHTTN